MNAIEINNLTKSYGKSRGIIDLSLSIKEGEIFGFIGPNGSGKSTTIRTILNLITAQSGTATILGLDSKQNYQEILKEVGYLPSELFYYDNMKAEKLLKYSEKFYNKDCAKRRQELAELLNVDLSKKISDMSFGTKKKIGIIDALQHEPKILILDEPTSGLDPLIQKKFFELLEEEKTKGVTIFFSSHILSEVQKVCDRTAIIKDGKLITIEDIKNMSNQNFKKVTVTTNSEITINLSGATNITTVDNKTTFLHKGDANEVIKLLSQLTVEDFTVEEPDLEEIFMHYYE